MKIQRVKSGSGNPFSTTNGGCGWFIVSENQPHPHGDGELLPAIPDWRREAFTVRVCGEDYLYIPCIGIKGGHRFSMTAI